MLLYHHVKFTLGADPYSLLPQALARWNDLKRYHGWGDLRVEYAELNYILSNALTPDDSQFGQLWGLNNTGQSCCAGFVWGMRLLRTGKWWLIIVASQPGIVRSVRRARAARDVMWKALEADAKRQPY